MCKHCKDEKGKTIQCSCSCSDFAWQESESAQQEAVWLKCSECKHYLFYRAFEPLVFVGREMKRQEAHPHVEEIPRPRPTPIPKLDEQKD